MTHQLVIVTKEAKRVAVIDLKVLPNEDFVHVAKWTCSRWLHDHGKSVASFHASNGQFTVWLN